MSLFRKLFGTGDNPPDATKFDGTSEAALTRSLAALPPGEPGWVTFAEARNLFSTEGAEYAFGEMDKDGRRNIESFAAQHGSAINFMPNEQRVYFVRSHWGDGDNQEFQCKRCRTGQKKPNGPGFQLGATL